MSAPEKDDETPEATQVVERFETADERFKIRIERTTFTQPRPPRKIVGLPRLPDDNPNAPIMGAIGAMADHFGGQHAPPPIRRSMYEVELVDQQTGHTQRMTLGAEALDAFIDAVVVLKSMDQRREHRGIPGMGVML